ncbi:S9 family peptidase [Janibacter sp. GS2]|uniref:S9 family peptidase n=1 Tax=Janibacter sp. GS2 TaxID=3442646 RepID=UPI003EC08FCC
MRPEPTPPVAPERPSTRSHHGDDVVDPYAWMWDPEDADVRAHLEAENAYAEARTAHLAPLRQQLFDEIKERTLETDLSVPVASGDWWYYARTVEGQQYAIHCRAPLTDATLVPELDPTQPLAGEVVLLDGNALARGHEFFSLGGLEVSADHTRLAYAVDVTGDERFDVRVIDITSGDVLDEAVTGAGYGLAFSRDGGQLFHVAVDDAWRPHEVWRHEVGTAREGDVLVHREDDERFWMGLGVSRDERWILLGLGSKTSSEVHLIDADDPTAAARCVAPRREGVEYDVEPADDHLLIVHNERQPEGDLAWAPLDATGPEQWQPLLQRAEGERFLEVDSFDDFAVLSLRADGLPALRILPRLPGTARYGAPMPVSFDDELHSVALGPVAEPGADRIRVIHESWVSPRSVLDIVVETGERIVLKRQRVLGGVDPQDYEQRRTWASAPDGTQVPVSLVMRRGTEPDGTNPGLLYGYGSYEMSFDPYFSIARLSLLDRGLVYAVAHVRGGGELGRHWYDDGKMLHKRNTFTDFVAAAEHLHETGWVARDRLAAEGGSAGGLLVGAATNLAPDRFAAVLAAVPFVDTLTTILRPELPLTVGEWEEWGNPLDDPEVYAYMRSYSPYENVAAVEYPAILATTSLHDTRVYFTEPAKWTARLRAVTQHSVDRPILLRTEMSAGHGGRSGRYDAWEQTAWEWAWLLDRIGAGTLAP